MDQEEEKGPVFHNREDLSNLAGMVEEIKSRLGEYIVGQQEMVELLITGLLADGHILVEGVPGVAKTLTSKLLAKAISVDFSRVQFTPDLMPSDVLGTSVFNQKEGNFEFHRGPVFTNILLVDEINRAPAKTQSALFEVMEEQQVTIEGRTYKMSLPFMVIATQNPIEYEGTYRLPEGQLDRFLFKVEVDYPDLEEETRIISEYQQRKNNLHIDEFQPVMSAEQLNRLREQVKTIHLEENLAKYIAKIVHETRNNKDLYLGASPRASLAILFASKAYAAISGRDFVNPEDIQKVAVPALVHRIILNPEKEMEGSHPKTVIREMLEKIEVPR